MNGKKAKAIRNIAKINNLDERDVKKHFKASKPRLLTKFYAAIGIRKVSVGVPNSIVGTKDIVKPDIRLFPRPKFARKFASKYGYNYKLIKC